MEKRIKIKYDEDFEIVDFGSQDVIFDNMYGFYDGIVNLSDLEDYSFETDELRKNIMDFIKDENKIYPDKTYANILCSIINKDEIIENTSGHEIGKIMIFDVESDGLFGEGFAVSAIILNIGVGDSCKIVDCLNVKCSIQIKDDWVRENVLPHLDYMETVYTVKEVRDRFYDFYKKYIYDLKHIYSDCNFPVETNFVSAMVMDNLQERQTEMPYPLEDICTRKNRDINRKQHYIQKNAQYIVMDVATRMPQQHNPLWDCICSAYFLLNKK